MTNVISLAERRPSQFASLHPEPPGRPACDCAACDVRRMGRTAERLRNLARGALLVDGNAIADEVDQIVYDLGVLCGFNCQRADTRETPETPETGR